MLTNSKIMNWKNRDSIPKYIKFKEKPSEGRHLVNYKAEKDYDYYKCDYCNDEIKIFKNHNKMTGGIVIIPATITRSHDLELVLHNKCLNPLIKEFENKMIEENYNHIPMIN